MSATVRKYVPPFISQKRKDTPPYDDCAIESGLMLAGSWTLGEALRRPDGELRPVHDLSKVLREKIGDTTGGLTLAQVDDALRELDPELPPLPRYPGQSPAPSAGATLRLDWREFRRLLEDGHCAILLGYQPGASIGHAIFVARGTAEGALVMDPWLNKPLGYGGDVWDWPRLRAFTERTVAGHRYGSDDAIACAVVDIGAETEANRTERRMERAVERAEAKRAAAIVAKGAAEAALDEEKAAHLLTQQALHRANEATGSAEREVEAVRTMLEACEARQPENCEELRAEHAATVAQLAEATERAQRAEDALDTCETTTAADETFRHAVKDALAAREAAV